MTIERDGEFIEMCCDHKGCKRTVGPFKSDEFRIMTLTAKDSGWVTFQIKGKWHNFCDWLHGQPDQRSSEPYWIMEYEDDTGKLRRTRTVDGDARPVTGTWLRTYEVPAKKEKTHDK